MSRLRVLVIAAAATVWLPAGCRSIREYPPVPANLQSAASLPEAGSDASPIHLVDYEDWETHKRPGPPENILVLSGGGMNGAFSAGVLVGWSKAGNRPEFDIVTGVSTGSLIAPLAFLGQDYDEQLKRLYTSESTTKIYKLLPLFLWSEAAASSEPLRKQIHSVMTPDLVDRIAQEHRKGRRLYVGTTNLDTQKPVVWDVGAIAAGDDPHRVELIHTIMLASCSVPGLLPPIEIDVQIDGSQKYSELHVDGGVGASMFLPPQSLVFPSESAFTPVRAASETRRRTTVYTIVAGKANPDPAPVKKGLLHLSGASLSGVLRAQQKHDLAHIYLLAYFANARFQLAAIPHDFPLASNSMEFELKTMRALFDEGHRLGMSSTGWKDVPPGVKPNEWTIPRSGTQLVLPSLSTAAAPGNR